MASDHQLYVQTLPRLGAGDGHGQLRYHAGFRLEPESSEDS
jgi:hypothetical protein